MTPIRYQSGMDCGRKGLSSSWTEASSEGAALGTAAPPSNSVVKERSWAYQPVRLGWELISLYGCGVWNVHKKEGIVGWWRGDETKPRDFVWMSRGFGLKSRYHECRPRGFQ